jgi:hypothetical protein
LRVPSHYRLLSRDSLVDGQQYLITATFGSLWQLTVLLALPILRCEPRGQESYAGNPLEDIHPAEFSSDSVEPRLFRLFEGLDSHLARDCRELIEKFSQGVPTLKIVDQVLEGNSRTAKAGRAIHNLRIHDNHSLSGHRLSL